MANIYNLFKFLQEKEGKEIPTDIALILKLIYTPDEITAEELTVKGDLELGQTEVTALPDNLKIQGDLVLGWSKLQKLPKNLTIDGDLYLYDSSIEEIPEDIDIKGTIYKGFQRVNIPDSVKRRVRIES